MDSISAHLKAKGLQQVNDPDRADIAISFTLGSRDKISVNSDPTTYRAAMVLGDGDAAITRMCKFVTIPKVSSSWIYSM